MSYDDGITYDSFSYVFSVFFVFEVRSQLKEFSMV